MKQGALSDPRFPENREPASSFDLQTQVAQDLDFLIPFAKRLVQLFDPQQLLAVVAVRVGIGAGDGIFSFIHNEGFPPGLASPLGARDRCWQEGKSQRRHRRRERNYSDKSSPAPSKSKTRPWEVQ